jgi:glycosyltransferase involved in cell wall biosynthesis
MSRRITIAHDYFGIRGGGERLALVAANALDARLIYGFRNAQSYDETMFPHDAIDLRLPSLLQRPGLRAAALAVRFAAAKSAFRDSPIRIFSGVAAPFAAETAAGVRNVYYCHTPPRFLYDQREHFNGTAPYNPLRAIALRCFQRGYESSVARMQVIVANSQTVRDRIQTYLGRKAEVVYPPCDLAAFRWQGQAGFYLSTARLSRLKRVDKIVEAFLQMPDKKLVVASGGEELPNLIRLSAGAPNITFLGWVSEEKLRELIGLAIATIYIPVDEDFGMSPVESMAAGKPVIGVAEGGLLETVTHGETGILLPPAISTEAIIEAVAEMTPRRSVAMREACTARAGNFSRERFVAHLRRAINDS